MPQANPRGTYLVIAEALRGDWSWAVDDDGKIRESTIMERFGAARTTVRRAMEVLEADNLCEPEPGVGWWPAGSRNRLWEQITEVFETDGLAVGDQFPSESELMKRTGATRSPVRRVLAQLESRGVLKSTHGKGRTVLALPGR
ncbi:GntR family transcriptional regulator [Streptomyces sp. AA1529]|uniref:GntR family transcriptional regulator n=1 Tax=Streptomyces sp. AA1529 TaxID=1203257 RepID=UPI003D70860F